MGKKIATGCFCLCMSIAMYSSDVVREVPYAILSVVAGRIDAIQSVHNFDQKRYYDALKALQDQNGELLRENEILRNSIISLEKHSAELRQRIPVLENHSQMLQMQNTALQLNVQQSYHWIDRLKRENVQFKHDLDRSRESAMGILRERRDLMRKINILSAQLKGLKETLTVSERCKRMVDDLVGE